jgi:hypothetical protein
VKLLVLSAKIAHYILQKDRILSQPPQLETLQKLHLIGKQLGKQLDL